MGTKDENLEDCRDANEDHGLGYDDIGCNKKYESQIGSVIPESDAQCWELSKFGFSEGDDDQDEDDKDEDDKDEDEDGSDDKDKDEDEDEDGSGDEEECEEDPKTEFLFKYNKKKDKVLLKKCGSLKKMKGKKKKKQLQKLCKMKKSPNKEFDVARNACPVSCGIC